jgi:hypothetical protein
MKTVKDLIEYLQTLEQDRLVLTNGYEGGYNNIDTAQEINVLLNVNTIWYYGPHDEAEDDEAGVKAYVF